MTEQDVPEAPEEEPTPEAPEAPEEPEAPAEPEPNEPTPIEPPVAVEANPAWHLAASYQPSGLAHGA